MCVFILFSPSSLIIHINISLYDTIYCTSSFYSIQLTMDDVSSETCLDWLNNMNFKNIVWFIKAISYFVLLRSLSNIHRIVVTKKELFRYGIKTDDECLYCGEHDSIDHIFNDCEFVKHFVKNVNNWFNAVNNSNFIPTIEENLFGIMFGPYDKTILRKFNYTTLFMRYYIHTCKMQNKAILHLSTFVDRVLSKYRIEKFT